MDWRGRAYYVVKLEWTEYYHWTHTLKQIPGVRLHCPTQVSIKKYRNCEKYNDELEYRGQYSYLIGCIESSRKTVEDVLNSAKQNEPYGVTWRQIEQKPKPYSPYRGFEERRCDLNSRKRCTHCMDC